MKTKVISIFVAVCMLLAAAAVSLTVANAADATADGQASVSETAALLTALLFRKQQRRKQRREKQKC